MNLLLIGGIPSSGSTVLMEFLSKYPRVISVPETGLFTNGSLFSKTSISDKENNLANGLPWIDIQKKISQALGKDTFLPDFDQKSTCPIHVLQNIIKPSNDEVVIEKTPENIFAFDAYLSSDVNRKVIVCTRDIENVCSSLTRRKFTILESVIIWFSHAFLIWKILQKYPKQVFHFRYQEFCHSPSDILVKLGEFLGENFPTIFSSKNDDNLNQKTQQWLSWQLKVSSWFLSDRYWSKKIDDSLEFISCQGQLGVSFEALLDVTVFKVSESMFLKPRSLDSVLSDGSDLNFLQGIDKINPIKLERSPLIIRSLLEAYPLYFE